MSHAPMERAVRNESDTTGLPPVESDTTGLPRGVFMLVATPKLAELNGLEPSSAWLTTKCLTSRPQFRKPFGWVEGS